VRLLLAAGLLAACSSNHASGGLAAGDGATADGYPSGPYGKTQGAVIPNMTWSGYVDDAADAVATTKPYVTYSLDDARRSGKEYAIVILAESGCTGCQKSGDYIVKGGAGAAVVAAGGVVIEVLETVGFTAQATQAELEHWVDFFMLPVTTVKDPDGTGTPTLDTLGQREQAFVIDLRTMTIVDVIQGDLTGIGPSSAQVGFAEMLRLLGK
jgi:hypothetical protein